MLAVNIAVLIGVFLYKITREPYVPYIHLLVDYHFGFTKRALIGAVVSLFSSKVPVWLVFALSGGVWLVTLGLFVQLFRRTFGLDDAHMPLFVFMAGSPFFLKNFMHTLGHFDIYGCALAICLLLVPARSVTFVISATIASMILILIHHIHLLMYVPTSRSSWCCVIISCRVLPGEMLSWASLRHFVSGCCSSPRNFGERWRCRRRSLSVICRAAWPTRPGPIC